MTLEWVQDDPEELPQPPRRVRRAWVWWTLAAVVAVATAAVAVSRGGDAPLSAGPPTSARPPAPGSSATTASAASSASAASTPATPSTPTTPPPSRPVVTQLGHPLLGITAGWNLFARGDGVVVRVEPARGRVTTTAVPQIGSSGPVGFLVGPGGVIVRPLDEVPGFSVPDGQPARTLSGALVGGVATFPGPGPFQVWLAESRNGPAGGALLLYDLKRGAVVSNGPDAPADLGSPYAADGSGYLLYTGIGGIYDVRPGGIRRATTGSVIAVGPTSWLARECDEQFRCTSVLIDARTLARRVLGAGSNQANYLPGSISPDGRYAAYLADRGGGLQNLRIVDLTSGADYDTGVTPPDGASGGTTFAWSPDSTLLFAVDARGAIRVVDPTTRANAPLGVHLPPVAQLAIRPAG